MKKNIVFLTAFVLLSVSMVSAQSNQTQLDRGPGIISAGSPLYGLEVAADNAAVSIGLAKRGEIAKERAAEAKKAADNNKTKAAAKAGKNLAKMAEKSGSEDSEDIQTAIASFQDTMSRMEQRVQNAPNENARQGMQNALENMQTALQNMEQAQQNRQGAGQVTNRTGPPGNPTDGQQGREGTQNTTGTSDRQGSSADDSDSSGAGTVSDDRSGSRP